MPTIKEELEQRTIDSHIAYRRMPKKFRHGQGTQIVLPDNPEDASHALKFVLLGNKNIQEAIDAVEGFPDTAAIGEQITLTVTLGNPVVLRVVETNEESHICWARRKGKQDLSRFVLWEGELPLTHEVTLIFEKRLECTWRLMTAYPGKHLPREQNVESDPVAQAFWQHHAHILDPRAFDMGTLVSDLDYQAERAIQKG